MPYSRRAPSVSFTIDFAHHRRVKNFKTVFFVQVMALYPQTTCFYKAVVNKLPATHMDEYELLFEDANYPEGYSPPLCVAQRYVLTFKQNSKQA